MERGELACESLGSGDHQERGMASNVGLEGGPVSAFASVGVYSHDLGTTDFVKKENFFFVFLFFFFFFFFFLVFFM